MHKAVNQSPPIISHDDVDDKTAIKQLRRGCRHIWSCFFPPWSKSTFPFLMKVFMSVRLCLFCQLDDTNLNLWSSNYMLVFLQSIFFPSIHSSNREDKWQQWRHDIWLDPNKHLTLYMLYIYFIYCGNWNCHSCFFFVILGKAIVNNKIS